MGGLLSVVVTVTVTVTVAWPFSMAAFSFTGTPIGAYVVPALSALDVDVLVTLASVGWGLSVAADEGVTEACALFSLGGTRSFWGAVTTANKAFGIESVELASAAVVSGVDGVASELGDLSNGLESWTSWTAAVTVGNEEVGAIFGLWMVGCAAREEVIGCAGSWAPTLCEAWLKSPSACNSWAGCEVTAIEAVVEDDEPASILSASLRTMHCTTIPV